MPVQKTGGESTLTIGEVFDQKALWKWWEQNGGKGTQMFDGVSEKGIDYSSTFGTLIGVPVGGVILRIQHNTTSVGDVVELQASDGSVWLYQHITARVKVKQKLGVGDLVGLENGLPVDQYSTGPHIEVRYCQPERWNPAIDNWNEPWVNPYSLFSSLSNQQAGAVGTSTYSPSDLLANAAGKLSLAPNAGVGAVLYSLDQIGQIINPFDTSQDNIPQDTVLGATFDDPVRWLAAVGGNFVGDGRAIIFRLFLLLVGGILIYQAFNKFVNVGAVVNAAANIGKSAALLA